MRVARRERRKRAASGLTGKSLGPRKELRGVVCGDKTFSGRFSFLRLARPILIY